MPEVHDVAVRGERDGGALEALADRESRREILMLGTRDDAPVRRVLRHEPGRELGCREVVGREVFGVADLFGLSRHEARPLLVEVDELLGDRATLGGIRRQEGCRGEARHDRAELPSEVEAVLHRDVHPLPCLRAVGVACIAGEEDPREAVGAVRVVEAVGDPVADLVDAVPGDLPHVERVGVEDLVRAADDLLDRRLPHAVVVVCGDRTEVDVHATEVAALARDVQDVARLGVDRALDAPVGEVGLDEHVHDAPRVLRDVTDVHPPNLRAHAAARAVAADDVARADRAFGAGGILQAHLHRGALVARHGESEELHTVVRHDAAGPVRGGLGEVVEHTRLIDDEVRELADVVRVISRARAPDDAARIRGVGSPEVHPADVVRLGDDPLSEAESLERLDAARLDAVGLTDREAAVAALDDARHDTRILRELGREQHACGPGPDDQDVDLVGNLHGAVDPGSGSGLDARVG